MRFWKRIHIGYLVGIDAFLLLCFPQYGIVFHDMCNTLFVGPLVGGVKLKVRTSTIANHGYPYKYRSVVEYLSTTCK